MKIVRLVLVLFLAALCDAAITGPVQQATNTAATATTVVVTIANPAAGALLVVVVSMDKTGNAVSGVTGGGVTWALAKAQATSDNPVEIWYGPNSSGSGTSVTVTFAGKVTSSANVSEWAGAATSSVLDVTGGGAGTSTAPATGNIVTTNADDLLIAGAGEGTATRSTGPNQSFTALTLVQGGADGHLAPAYRIVAATGTYSTDWTISGSVSWNAAIASFKGAVVGGAVIKDPIKRGWIAAPR